ncbi:hypothetical protein GFS31_00280 [Leptolyngbya sp. BL0902]|nr:hypothetical protein GFS31_00280 [Leptolyngbya sp. BL0902]
METARIGHGAKPEDWSAPLCPVAGENNCKMNPLAHPMTD